MIGDLHCHTRFSDGSIGIDDLIFHAKRAGLDFVGVTDHDTMAGIKRAELLGKRYGIGIVGGVEISARDFSNGRRVHLLCYLPKVPDRLEGLLKRTLEGRNKALRESMQKVMRLYPVTEEHIMRYASGAAGLYSVHIMSALCDLGYADGVYGTLYQKLLGPKTGICFVPHEYEDVWEVAKQIKSAGGICVLAHPSNYQSIGIMQQLAAEGLLDGIERYHPKVKQEDIPIIEQTIEKYGLIATGGTDFHGKNASKPNPLGTCLTMQESLERLFKLAKSK